MIFKKGVSPIIATVLLVVLALILVVILLSWGQNFINRNTSDVDNTIDRKCLGAGITINNCNYNDQTNTLSFIIVNSGKVNFSKDHNLNLILIDAEGNLNNDNQNIIISQAFNRLDSQKIVIDHYAATTPIDVEVRSTQCVNYFAKVSCN
ncbi:MAG TPA: hypothetical protein P5530_03820 [Candidatus Diapherotrites archaeon]|nr:hypothetical protein [Candidatus Diapherotrites archaeon]